MQIQRHSSPHSHHFPLQASYVLRKGVNLTTATRRKPHSKRLSSMSFSFLVVASIRPATITNNPLIWAVENFFNDNLKLTQLPSLDIYGFRHHCWPANIAYIPG